MSYSSLSIVKRNNQQPSGAVTLNKIGDTLLELKDVWAVHNAQKAAHDAQKAALEGQRAASSETYEQVVNGAMAFAAELEGTITDNEKVAIFDLFIRDSMTASAFANVPKKEWQQAWVEKCLVELGLHTYGNNLM